MKLVAESDTWKFYDNGVINKIKGGEIILEERCGEVFLSYLKKLIPGRQYNFLKRWKENWNFNECFIEFSRDHPTYETVVKVYGFDPVITKCKECGFEIESKVCSNCGEWN